MNATLVADALRLCGAPACACDVNGVAFGANPELEALLGGRVDGRALLELFRGRAAHTGVRLRTAFERAIEWDGVLALGATQLEVQVRAKPLPASAGIAGATFVFTDIGRFERHESALRIALLEHRAILENAPVGILFTLPGQLKSCNPRLAEMLRQAPEDIVNAALGEYFLTREQCEAFLAEFREAMAAGRMFEKLEYQFRRHDGSAFWCRVRARAVDSSDRQAGAIWIFEDVTDARQAMIEVQAIMTNASISILFTKHDVITRYNRGFAEMFGYDHREALGMPARALYGGEQAYLDIREVAHPLLQHGKPFHAETEMVRKDGARMWVQLIGYVVNPEDPDQGTIWIIEDRTVHKRDEESLRNAVLENQAILDTAVLGIAVVEQGRTLHCNAKMEELFGYGPGGITGASVRSLYPDTAGWEAARRDTAADFAADRVHMGEYELARRDGSRFWARLSGRPFDLAD
ncbi:MAG: PAS domain-containing protein, partial [Telluria sp.]